MFSYVIRTIDKTKLLRFSAKHVLNIKHVKKTKVQKKRPVNILENDSLHAFVRPVTGSRSSLIRRVFSRYGSRLRLGFADLDPCTFLPP